MDMEYLSKSLFFVFLVISILLVLFSIYVFFDVLLDPAIKKSDAYTFLQGGGIIVLGLYFTYQYGYMPSDFMKGLIILVVTLIIAIVWVIIGLFFLYGIYASATEGNTQFMFFCSLDLFYFQIIFHV